MKQQWAGEKGEESRQPWNAGAPGTVKAFKEVVHTTMLSS